MTDTDPTPFVVRRGLFTPGAVVERRPATVAECRQVLADSTTERCAREWFFGLFRGQEEDDVRRWLRGRGRFRAKT